MTSIAIMPENTEPFVIRRNVTEALASVIAELPSIGKGGKASAAQGGYSYRGIEQIVSHVAPLLAKHGIVYVPRVVSMETREITVNGKPWTDTILTVGYRIHGPSGADDFLEATVVGIGRDNSDKGANKALTQAFKYVLIQTLCIADDKDDSDGETHEADARPEPAPARALLPDRVAALTDEQRDGFVAWKKDQGFPFPWPPEAIESMHTELDRLAEEPF